MAQANTYLNVTELDFNQIKTNLKSYLVDRPEFKDYNFEGSVINSLLDVLAYNTHYNAYYINMIANEMFLDTAQQRDSVVSRARELGYLPGSAVGSSANVNLTFTGVANDVTRLTVAKNSTFTTRIDNITYTYVLPETKVIDTVNGSFSVDVQIREGTPLQHRTTYSSANKTKIIIPNQNVDTSSIRVRVQESSDDATLTEFTRATNISEIKSTSPIYFIEEAPDFKYEIIFGSGSLGKALKNGNIVIVDYLVNHGPESDGANVFTPKSVNVDKDYGSINVTTNKAAIGGTYQESIESIKFNAPRHYQTQNRAVVAEDFTRIILAEQTDVESCVAYGGEQAEPPVPGKVYIAIKPSGELFFTEQRKAEVRTSIESRTMLSIEPVIIDPVYTFIVPTITTYYQESETTLRSGDIRNLVLGQVDAFSAANLEGFGNKMRFSRFLRTLDNLDGSIVNNDAILEIQKRFTPDTNIKQRVYLEYNNPIRPNTVLSTEFTYSGFEAYFEDDGNGNINIFRYDNSKKVNIVEKAGTVKYDEGIVEVNAFEPTAYSGIEIKVNVRPDTLDITPVREQILLMNSSDAKVTVFSEK